MHCLDLYYAVKPFIPRQLQIRTRRHIVSRLRPHAADQWPILERAATKPNGWPGWPDGKTFAIVLTHDVETALGLARCRHLMALEEEHGYRSAFNLVPERYEVDAALRNEMVKRGFEVGVHGLNHDGRLFRSHRIFRERARRINAYLREWKATGFRAPSMRVRLDWLRELRIAYDSSTFDTDPFEPRPHGAETIFPFWVPCGDDEGFVELPYTLPQDFTLFVLAGETDAAVWKRKLDWIAQHGGMALLDTHPDYMSFDGASAADTYPAALYADFLRYIAEHYGDTAWLALPREIADYCGAAGRRVPRARRKRVCMVAYAFYETDNRIIRYAESLAGRGDEVDVLALRRHGLAKREIMNGVQVHRIQHRTRNERNRLDYLSRLLRFLLVSSAVLMRRHRQRPYDVVHVHSVPDFEVFAAWWIKLTGGTLILDIHDIVPEFYISKFEKSADSLLFRMLLRIEKLSTAFADHVIIANDIWRQKLISRATAPHKCTTILNVPDERIFHPRPAARDPGRFRFLYPGGLQWHQGLDLAIRAFAQIAPSHPQAEFQIHGEGSEKEALQALIAELGMAERIAMRPLIPYHAVPDLMATADAGIVAKRANSFGNEAFSTKVMEYMTQSVPVIVARTAIDTYYFDDSIVLFFASGNVDELADCMRRMMDDAGLRERLTTNAQQYVARHGWRPLRDTYFDIVDGTRGQPSARQDKAATQGAE